MFKEACALRQGQSVTAGARRRRPVIEHILVALGMRVEEYVMALRLLETTFGQNDKYNVRIRPHPLIPLQPAIDRAYLAHPDFYSPSTGALADDLQWADAVLYSSSTVGLEAVLLGIPSVYLDVDSLLKTDPMFGWADFKWSATGPMELIAALDKIGRLSDEQFKNLQKKGIEYATGYLSPITESALEAFGVVSMKASTANPAETPLSHPQ